MRSGRFHIPGAAANRVRFSAPRLARLLFLAFVEAADFFSSRRMLTGVKRRAESHYPGPVDAVQESLSSQSAC